MTQTDPKDPMIYTETREDGGASPSALAGDAEDATDKFLVKLECRGPPPRVTTPSLWPPPPCRSDKLPDGR